MRPFLIGLMISTTLVLPFVSADPQGACDSKGQPSLGIIDLGGAYYVDDRNAVDGNGVYVYAESNGEAGLQRGTWICLGLCGFSDPCTDDSPNGPDTLLISAGPIL